jgi:hypothetical protein
MSAEGKPAKPHSEDVEKVSVDKPNVTLAGKVEKIIPAIGNEPEKAQITVEGAQTICTARLESKTLCRTGTASR